MRSRVLCGLSGFIGIKGGFWCCFAVLCIVCDVWKSAVRPHAVLLRHRLLCLSNCMHSAALTPYCLQTQSRKVQLVCVFALCICITLVSFHEKFFLNVLCRIKRISKTLTQQPEVRVVAFPVQWGSERGSFVTVLEESTVCLLPKVSAVGKHDSLNLDVECISACLFTTVQNTVVIIIKYDNTIYVIKTYFHYNNLVLWPLRQLNKPGHLVKLMFVRVIFKIALLIFHEMCYQKAYRSGEMQLHSK